MSDNHNEEYEDLIQDFLESMVLSEKLKKDIEYYDLCIVKILKDKRMLDICKSNSIFDVMQSLEGFNSSFHDLTQKIYKLISLIKVQEKEESKKENVLDKDDIKKDNLKNPLVNNAVDYLRDVFKDNMDNKKGNENE